MMLDLEIGEQLRTIASSELDFKTVVYKLVKEFERRENLLELIKGAYEDKVFIFLLMNNPKM